MPFALEDLDSNFRSAIISDCSNDMRPGGYGVPMGVCMIYLSQHSGGGLHFDLLGGERRQEAPELGSRFKGGG